ncbi:DNA-binding response regulator [Vibrio sp. vnigr-6D03]|uniref:DNA-binding response regulator n=1 Tax=Vibrio penaeicida TaxID=104609 RepID=A0AAV5NVY0_9VIBR|nr:MULTISPECIES: response regulator transcription factor [Vibrio]PKF81688.1 DNA-binding response regulator [Vibrio sp. vnigr-6D03]RTZ20634.1 response regulator transcription factor [Vibrio penaeicida]GLQ74419.1 DNA-binding response regulator [Vibrio penaeicida]
MRVLLIEDDSFIADFVIQGLEQEGYSVTHTANGLDGAHLAKSEPFDILILDIMLPGKDGFQILSELRGEGHAMPVIILSAKHSVEERVQGLKAGADDYLIKPFAFSELLVRCQTLLRRMSVSSTQNNTLKYRDVELDPLKRDLKRSGKAIALNQREFALAYLLLQNPEMVLSKTNILESVWGYQFDPQTNVVDVLVCRLRAKLDKGFDQSLIHTIRGVGYVLKAEH